jgi:hypothetical protein
VTELDRAKRNRRACFALPASLASALLVACSASSTATGTKPLIAGHADSSVEHASEPSETHVGAVVWVDEMQLCNHSCEWLEGTPWTETSRESARRVQTALYLDFVRAVTAHVPVSQCAPNLALQLQKTPQLKVYVKGEVPDQLMNDRRLNVQRVSPDEFDREMGAPRSDVALLVISVVEPTQLAGTSDVGIGFSCDTRTPFDGRQGRGGVALQRDEGIIHSTLTNGYDE